MKPWTALTHELLSLSRKRGWKGSASHPARLGLAVSGGADSIAMLCLFVELRSSLSLELHVLHVHHGGASVYRQEASRFVRQLAESLGCAFHEIKAPNELRSEAEMRTFRRDALKKWRAELGLQWVALAHHSEDLLETRLIRLLRGTGPQGLKAMAVENSYWIRPFLKNSPQELREDLQKKGQKFLEDPSNKDSVYLRNWLRNRFLPQLEKKRKGSLTSLAQSLELLVERMEMGRLLEMESLFLESGALSRMHYKNLSELEQKQALALWLRKLGCRNYSHNHVEEMRKQLDNSRNEHSFKLLGLLIRANAKQIEAVPL